MVTELRSMDIFQIRYPLFVPEYIGCLVACFSDRFGDLVFRFSGVFVGFLFGFVFL